MKQELELDILRTFFTGLGVADLPVASADTYFFLAYAKDKEKIQMGLLISALLLFF